MSLSFENKGKACNLTVLDVYTGKSYSQHFEPGQIWINTWLLIGNYGWYDFVIHVDTDPSFEQRVSGHVETGIASMTDPAIAAPAKQ